MGTLCLPRGGRFMSYSETSHVTIWTWPVKIGTVIAIFLVAYALAYCVHIRFREEVPGLTGEHRDRAIKGATRICTTTVRADPDNKVIPASTLARFCSCYANGVADRVSLSDIRLLVSGGLTQEAASAKLQEPPAIQAKMQAAWNACVDTVSQ
jgi:hypothetical protein